MQESEDHVLRPIFDWLYLKEIESPISRSKFFVVKSLLTGRSDKYMSRRIQC